MTITQTIQKQNDTISNLEKTITDLQKRINAMEVPPVVTNNITEIRPATDPMPIGSVVMFNLGAGDTFIRPATGKRYTHLDILKGEGSGDAILLERDQQWQLCNGAFYYADPKDGPLERVPDFRNIPVPSAPQYDGSTLGRLVFYLCKVA